VPGKAKDITGVKFGRFLVVKRDGSNRDGSARWECVCDCGTRKTVGGRELWRGRTISCGCLNAEILANRARTHGMSGHPAYQSWVEMRTRCHNSSRDSYQDYGGRGIRVCDRWRDSFESFWADMGSTYEPGLTIDRIDVNKGYEPGNCQWATRKQQNRNTRRNMMIQFRGETRCLGEWCELLDLPYHSIYTRLSRGWPVERALTEPIHR
jgi:hypothetical protein